MFMFWMIGNGISIFTIFFIFQSLFSSVTALLKTSKGTIYDNNKVFEPFESMVSSTFKYKVIYCAINLVLLGIVAYKLSSMGLLPVSAADYVDLVPTY
jgi:preprotein translocase subunit SecY